MTLVLTSPAAERDLERIWLLIAADNPPAATRIVRAINARIANLAYHARMGPRRSDIQASARILVKDPYLIVYRTHPDTDEGPVDEVEVVRVVDGRRDLSQPF